MALEDIGSSKSDFGGVKLNSIGEVLNRYGQLFVDATTSNLEKLGKNASSELMQSISFDIEIIGMSYRFTISMADYWEWVDQGRAPGKNPPLKPIVEWIFQKPSFRAKIGATTKSLKGAATYKLGDIVAPKQIISAAIAVQKSIGKNGTKASNFFSSVVNEKSLMRMQEDLSIALGKDVEITINDIAKEINGGKHLVPYKER